ncbi:type III-A CRISPR-associated RAMP protein Csm5 [Mycobacterium sp. SM1]|uniref:type III-A CRISPR-associated RAMP protein Csm5 n=1 Tax=Mycobacterium sp. SM1 TaxID=2816243 RepID=UPI001BCAE4C3|nr:type III-A CRISPR-associated RAMP protein Csm5 [Mycobacterium sp. SM1]MBS4728528.1 type III-A CRISPR-associated RAMP protein Csm5 [Mycobacterium sp. SM1]
MSAYLKTFELTLKCLGPVFIGSGEKRTSKEYVLGKQIVYFPDMHRLYADIAAQGKAASFEEFVMNTGGAQAASRLGDWLSRNGIQPSLAKHGGYWVRIGTLAPGRERRGPGGQRIREQHPLNEIHAFIKNAYGKPYVPGSSIKGLLRSLYLQAELHRRPQPLRVKGSTKGEQGQSGERAERSMLRKAGRLPDRPQDAVNDLFQAIRVGDSAPLGTSDLVICQKIDMNVHGDVGGLPLFRECLTAGATIAVRLTVDTRPPQQGGWPDGERFLDSLERQAGYVNKERYAGYAAKFWDDQPQQGPIVYLGGGAGYRSKTFVTEQDDMATVLDLQFPKIKHAEKTRELGVSPLVLKLTKIGETHYEMGMCELSIKRAGG